MSRYDERSYSKQYALKNIGAAFLEKYRSDLLAYAQDRTRSDIPARIHEEWDATGRSPSGTDIRIEWALALYDHDDWPGVKKAAETKEPGKRQTAETADKKRCSNCFYSKNPDNCPYGMLGPCEGWREATEKEDYWPTWEDMKRAEYADYRERYRE